MKEHDIRKIHKILAAKKIRYHFKRLVLNLKALVVDFIPLSNISQKYCTEKIILGEELEVLSYLPNSFDNISIRSKHTRNKITAYALKNLYAIGNSSFFLTKNKEKIFYEKMQQDNRYFYIYNHENIVFHSDSLAKIKNYPVKIHSFEALFFGGTFAVNYYHFLVEILSKAEYLSKIPDHKNLKIVLDISIQKNENLSALATFFFKEYEVVFIDNLHYHSFEKLWFITTPNPTIPNILEGAKYEAEFTKITPESISYIKDICLKNYDPRKVRISPVSKIFVARKSKFRKYNEAELLSIAKNYGFLPVYFEDLNLHEQIFMMKNADYIVGSSGAAWTNLIFAGESTKALIWLGSVWGDFSVFSTLANLVNFELYTMRHQNKTNDFHESYILEEEDFENNLKKLLEI